MIPAAVLEEINRRVLDRVLVEAGAAPVGRKWSCWNKSAHKNNDSTPALVTADGRWKCWACGEHGDAIDLLQKTRGLQFRDAAAAAASMAGITLPEEAASPDVAARRGRARVAAYVLDALVAKWAAALDVERLAEYLVGAAADEVARVAVDERIGWASGDADELVAELCGGDVAAGRDAGLVGEDGRPSGAFYAMCRGGGLVVPMIDRGRVVGLKCRRPKGEPRWLCLARGEVRPGQAATGLDDGGAALLVEGEGDRLAVLATGAKVAPVAVGTWAGRAGDDADALRARLWRDMRAGRRVYIALDDDDPGRAAAASLAAALPGAYICTWPRKDARAALADGVLDVAAVIGTARQVSTARSVALPPAPRGYILDERGVAKSVKGKDGKKKRVGVVPLPFWVAGAARDVESGVRYMTLAWVEGERVATTTMPREVALSTSVQTAASQGAPIAAATARDVTRYLLAADSEWQLPAVERLGRLGWHGDAFVLGDRCLGGGLAPAVATREAELLVEGATTGGDREAWRGALREAMLESPVVALLVAAAAASPLLRRLGVTDSVIVNLCGRSSTGKTTAAMVAASFYSRPASVYRSWDLSDSSLEETCGTLHALPLILDEVSRCPSQERIDKIVYKVGNGHGRPLSAWSAKKRATPRWQLVAFSTGERSLLSGAVLEGQAVRAVEVFDAPFKSGSAELVKRCRAAVDASWGWGSEWLAVARGRSWEKEIAEARADYAASSDTAGRVADFGAAVGAVAVSVLEWLGDKDPAIGRVLVARVLKSAARGAADVQSYAEAALGALLGAVAANLGAFGDHPPMGRACGRVEDGEVAILPVWGDDILKRAGYEPRTVVKRWAALGWLIVDEGRTTAKRAIAGGRARCYVVKRERVEDILELPPPEAAPYHEQAAAS